MITLERLVELRSDEGLVEHLKQICEHATSLVAVDLMATTKTIAIGKATAATYADSRDGALAMMLAVYEEGRVSPRGRKKVTQVKGKI